MKDYSQPLLIIPKQDRLRARAGWLLLLSITLGSCALTKVDTNQKVKYYKSIIAKQEAEITKLKKTNTQISWDNSQQRQILSMAYPKAQYDFTPPLDFKGVY